jgi:hypothetical protein
VLGLLAFWLAFLEAFAAVEELRAATAVWEAATLQEAWPIVWSRVLPWTGILGAVQIGNGLLVYRENPWLAVPDWLGMMAGVTASLVWRKWRDLRDLA